MTLSRSDLERVRQTCVQYDGQEPSDGSDVEDLTRYSCDIAGFGEGATCKHPNDCHCAHDA